jgi:hypothetical protein
VIVMVKRNVNGVLKSISETVIRLLDMSAESRTGMLEKKGDRLGCIQRNM